MTYPPASPGQTAGKSYLAEIATPNILPKKGWSEGGGNQEGLLYETRIFHGQVWKVWLLQHPDYSIYKVNMHSFNKCLLKSFYIPVT